MAQARSRRSLGFPVRTRLDPRREIKIDHVTDGPARGWLHTHGLAAHGKPELEMRNVPLFLGPVAAGLLNDVADYLLNDADKPLLAGQLVHLGRSSIRVVEGRADEEVGYDPAHYRDVRLTLEDPPATGFECDECTREHAALNSLRS